MPKFRFSLLVMFVAIALVAVGCAAMVKPSYAWASAIWTIAMAPLAGSMIGCFYGTRQSRAFCAGFACFGWGHMVLCFAPWFESHTGELLFTRSILSFVGERLGHGEYRAGGIWNQILGFNYTDKGFVYFTFIIIGQSLMTLLIALLGGLLGQHLGSLSVQPRTVGAAVSRGDHDVSARARLIERANDEVGRLLAEEAALCDAGRGLVESLAVLAYNDIYSEYEQRRKEDWPAAAAWFLRHVEGKSLADFAPRGS